jgi:ABC-type cobalamin/Fe3+-siderophores transport system ATPase subunit
MTALIGPNGSGKSTLLRVHSIAIFSFISRLTR